MRNVAYLMLTLFFVGMTFTSCKKDYTCTCVTEIDGLDPVTNVVSYDGVKKSEAEDACDILDGAANTTCTLEEQ